MTQPCFCMSQSHEKFIQGLYLAKVNLLLRIDYIAQMVDRRKYDLEIAGQCSFKPAVPHDYTTTFQPHLSQTFRQPLSHL